MYTQLFIIYFRYQSEFAIVVHNDIILTLCFLFLLFLRSNEIESLGTAATNMPIASTPDDRSENEALMDC
jgi:hypothetical protein